MLKKLSKCNQMVKFLKVISNKNIYKEFEGFLSKLVKKKNLVLFFFGKFVVLGIGIEARG